MEKPVFKKKKDKSIGAKRKLIEHLVENEDENNINQEENLNGTEEQIKDHNKKYKVFHSDEETMNGFMEENFTFNKQHTAAYQKKIQQV